MVKRVPALYQVWRRDQDGEYCLGFMTEEQLHATPDWSTGKPVFEHEGRLFAEDELPVGAMYYDTNFGFTATQYERDWRGKRPPLRVKLPTTGGNGGWFSPDQPATDNAEGRGWEVTGQAPNITLSPSINIVGDYHGWLQNGVISDDLEGRIYRDGGKSPRCRDCGCA